MFTFSLEYAENVKGLFLLQCKSYHGVCFLELVDHSLILYFLLLGNTPWHMIIFSQLIIFKTLTNTCSPINTKIMESLCIKTTNSALNNQTTSCSLILHYNSRPIELGIWTFLLTYFFALFSLHHFPLHTQGN